MLAICRRVIIWQSRILTNDITKLHIFFQSYEWKVFTWAKVETYENIFHSGGASLVLFKELYFLEIVSDDLAWCFFLLIARQQHWYQPFIVPFHHQMFRVQILHNCWTAEYGVVQIGAIIVFRTAVPGYIVVYIHHLAWFGFFLVF